MEYQNKNQIVKILGAFLGLLDGIALSYTANYRQGSEFRTEAVIEPAVYKGVVAGRAHGQPVKSEVQGIVSLDHFTWQQHNVTV